MNVESKQFYRTIASIALPLAAQNLINVAVQSADVVMLGKVGETVLSGASLAGQVAFVMSLFLFGLTSGACVLAAQYWGKRDIETIDKILAFTMKLGIMVAIMFTVVVKLFPVQVMSLFTNESDVVSQGVAYLDILSDSFIIMAITMTYLNLMRGIERVKIATLVYGVSLVVNITLNAIFIFGLLGFPVMGIQGAALGTLIARSVELIIVIVYDTKFNKIIKLKWHNVIKTEAWLRTDFIKISGPTVINELAWGVAMAVIAAIIGRLGQSAVAANSVAQVVRQLVMVLTMGIAAGTAVVIGKLIGEQKIELAQQYTKRIVRLVTIIGLIAGGIVLLLVPVVTGMLNLSTESDELLRQMLFYLACLTVPISINTTIVVGVLRAGGDTKMGLVIDLFGLYIVSIPLGLILMNVFHASTIVVYMCLLCDEWVKVPISIWRYRSGKWLKNVTRDTLIQNNV